MNVDPSKKRDFSLLPSTEMGIFKGYVKIFFSPYFSNMNGSDGS